MANGTTKRISEVRIGDRVRATDPSTDTTTNRRVEDVIVGLGAKRLVKLTINGRTMTATAGPPLWVESRDAWVDADDLREGDVLLEADGDRVEVDGVRIFDAADQTVYNLTVASTHTYHAGARVVLVHNCAQHKRWKPGDDELAPTAAGREPAWSTQRARHWKNEAKNPTEDWGPENLERMSRGRAPQRTNPKTGQKESMELDHHPVPRRRGGRRVRRLWPPDHARLDPFRHLSKK